MKVLHSDAWTDDEREAVAVIERQLQAYNAHNLDALCACIAEDVIVYQFGVDSPAIQGRAAFREKYRLAFETEPNTRAIVERREVFDRFVVDFERVIGYSDRLDRRIRAVYQVRGGQITRIWYSKATIG